MGNSIKYIPLTPGMTEVNVGDITNYSDRSLTSSVDGVVVRNNPNSPSIAIAYVEGRVHHAIEREKLFQNAMFTRFGMDGTLVVLARERPEFVN